jgi:chromosome segregation ATPase
VTREKGDASAAPRQRPKREPTDPLRAELMEMASKYSQAYHYLEDCNREKSAAETAVEKLTRERTELQERLAATQRQLADAPSRSDLEAAIRQRNAVQRDYDRLFTVVTERDAKIIALTRERDDAISNLADALHKPKTLWQAAMDLAAEIRAFVEAVPAGLTFDEEHERLFQPFLETYWPRLHHIQDRLENVLPRQSVFTMTKDPLPSSKQNVMEIGNNLERAVLNVDK